MFRILVSDKLGTAGLALLDQAADVQYDLKPTMSKSEFLQLIPGYEALIVRSGTAVDEDVLAAGTHLRVVGRAGVGIDNIDVPAASGEALSSSTHHRQQHRHRRTSDGPDAGR